MGPQTSAVLDLIRHVLDDRDLVGVYLHGSAVLGGLRPASDLDVLVLTRRTLDGLRRNALLDGLLRLSGFPPAARPIELAVVVESDVRPWRCPPTVDFLYGEWLRGTFTASGPPHREPMPDLAVLITTVLTGDRALLGPPPSDVFVPVPRTDLIRASAAAIPDLLAESEDDTRNVVLTLARIWATTVTGRIEPKDVAATWALDRLPPEQRPVLEHARMLYLNSTYDEEFWSPDLRALVRPCAERLVAEIAFQASA